MTVTITTNKNGSRTFDLSLGDGRTYDLDRVQDCIPHERDSVYIIKDNGTGASITIPGEVLTSILSYVDDDYLAAMEGDDGEDERWTRTRGSCCASTARTSSWSGPRACCSRHR